MKATIKKLLPWTKEYHSGFRFRVSTEDGRYSECVRSYSLAEKMAEVLQKISAETLDRISQVEEEIAQGDLENKLWDLAYDIKNELSEAEGDSISN